MPYIAFLYHSNTNTFYAVACIVSAAYLFLAFLSHYSNSIVDILSSEEMAQLDQHQSLSNGSLFSTFGKTILHQVHWCRANALVKGVDPFINAMPSVEKVLTCIILSVYHRMRQHTIRYSMNIFGSDSWNPHNEENNDISIARTMCTLSIVAIWGEKISDFCSQKHLLRVLQ